MRFAAVTTAIVLGALCSGVSLDVTPTLHAARVLSLDTAIRLQTSPCVEPEAPLRRPRESRSISRSVQVESSKLSPSQRPEAWPSSPWASESSAERLLGVLGLLVVFCGAAALGSTTVYMASRQALEPSLNAKPGFLTVRRVVRDGCRWRIIPTAVAACHVWALGGAATWVVISAFHAGEVGSIVLIVAGTVAITAACLPPFCAAANWPPGLARARFVRHWEEDAVATRAGWLRRRCFFPRGEWQFASTWDSDVVNSVLLGITHVVPRRLHAPLVETLVTVTASAAVGLAADCRPGRAVMVWCAVVHGGSAFLFAMGLPFVLPWAHVSHFFVSVLLAAACRFVGVSPPGFSHELSVADRLVAAAASLVSLEAVAIAGQSLWSRLYRRTDRYAARQIAFDRPDAEPLLLVPVHRRADAVNESDESEMDTDATSSGTDVDVPREDLFRPRSEIFVVDGLRGIQMVEFWLQGASPTETSVDEEWTCDLPLRDAAGSVARRIVAHASDKRRKQVPINPLTL